MKTFREKLIEHGASQVQLDSGVAKMAEDIITEMSDDEIKELGMGNIRKYVETLDKLCILAKKRIEEVKEIQYSFTACINDGRKVLCDMYDKIDTLKIEPSEETKQATLIFTNVLMQTKEIFGDNLSDEVMKSAIEAGSYGLWRSIMGDKFGKNKERY